MALDSQLHGFTDARFGMRTQNDPYEDQQSLAELRTQLDALTYFDAAELQVRADFVYDALADDPEKIDLENGEGFVDLREFNLLFTPVDWADVKVGRQILTWGTGDLLFINDLFPKDWNSFLLGRDVEYLKAPSDAIFTSLFPGFANIDIAYTPRFDADRYIDGSRVSYWNPSLGRIAGQDAVVQTEQPDDWFSDDEIATRIYRRIKGYETALYVYHGFWKSPAGMDMASGKATFPALNVYGASTKGEFKGGILNLETGFYDSRDDSTATTIAPKDELRFLSGYEREIAQNLTAGAQYYLEHTTADDRHVTTLRLTKMMMNQNLVLGLFVFYSPSDKDAYIRPTANYKLNDDWMLSATGGWFLGEDDDTFYGQFRNNGNLNFAVRYSF